MRSIRMALAALTGVALSVGGFASAAHADPQGNNGTVKIDAEAFDTAPDNQPHVGCRFQVDFYGFDQGDLNADVEFALHPPTGTDVVLLTDKVFIGEDSAGGGTDLDAEKTYDLSGRAGVNHPASAAGVPRQAHGARRRIPRRGSRSTRCSGCSVARPIPPEETQRVIS